MHLWYTFLNLFYNVTITQTGPKQKETAMFFKNAFEKQLDEKISRIQNNFENNYKDAAQLNLKEFEAMLNEMKSSGKIKEKRIAHYENKLSDYKNQMQKFTHKDQKCTW